MDKSCIVCGQPRKIGAKKFCSSKCYGKWASINRLGAKATHWAGGSLQKICKKCGRTFYVKKSLERVKHCSISCSKRGITPWNKKNTDEEKLEIEKSRKSDEYKKWRLAVYQRDKFSCQHCLQKLSDKEIAAHHIYYFSKFPGLRYAVKNGVTLCRSCHLKLHAFNKGADDIVFEAARKPENFNFLSENYL